jgi:pimeloyl-ACP methyl ester carboxylesterase
MHPDELAALAERVMEETDSTFGRYPGYRAAQAKGVLCRGWFTSTGAAAAFTRAPHLQPGAVTPVTVRFSNSSTNPERRDAYLDVRGLSASFHLEDEERTDIVAVRMQRFLVGTAVHFLRFQRQMRRNPWGQMPLFTWRVLPNFFLGPNHGGAPRRLLWWQIRWLCRIPTYAACGYNSLHAFKWVNAANASCHVRYSWVPGAGLDRLRWWRRYRKRHPDYLRRELEQRLGRGSVRFRLEVQIASSRDDVNDASKLWGNRPRLLVGILELTEMGGWASGNGRPLVFEPTRVTDGIEVPERDTLLQLRRYVYDMSARRRQEASEDQDGEPAEIPPETGDPVPPDLPADTFPQKAYVNGVDIAYATHGNPSDRPLLLIMGFACPMTWWLETFIEMFLDRGYYVICLDNRDCGQSARCGPAIASLVGILFPSIMAPYTIDDMAKDAADLLHAIGVDSAHVVGISLGGMIAQSMAINFPDRVRSLSCIASTPKFRRLPPPWGPTWRVLRRMAWQSMFPGRTMEEHVERSMPLWRLLNAGTVFPFDIDKAAFPFETDPVRNHLEHAWKWSGGADSRADFRQILAVFATRDRTSRLRNVEVPACVIHGSADPLVRVRGGRRTARALGVDPVIIKGMGHYTPQPTWQQIVDAIDAVATEADTEPD